MDSTLQAASLQRLLGPRAVQVLVCFLTKVGEDGKRAGVPDGGCGSRGPDFWRERWSFLQERAWL